MRHFRLEYILLYLHRISVFTQNLGQTHVFRYPSMTSSIILAPNLKLFWKIRQFVIV